MNIDTEYRVPVIRLIPAGNLRARHLRAIATEIAGQAAEDAVLFRQCDAEAAAVSIQRSARTDAACLLDVAERLNALERASGRPADTLIVASLDAADLNSMAEADVAGILGDRGFGVDPRDEGFDKSFDEVFGIGRRD